MGRMGHSLLAGTSPEVAVLERAKVVLRNMEKSKQWAVSSRVCSSKLRCTKPPAVKAKEAQSRRWETPVAWSLGGVPGHLLFYLPSLPTPDSPGQLGDKSTGLEKEEDTGWGFGIWNS